MGKRRTRTLLWLFFAGMLLLHMLIFWSLREKVQEGYPDFSIFYTAGTILHRGNANHLYDSALQFRVQQEFASQVYIRQGALPYNHPPFEALLFLPLALFSYPVAYAAWDFLNLAILAALPLLLRPHVPLLQRGSVVFWWLAELAFFPTFIALLQGQDSLLLLLLFSLAYVALKKNQEFAAGCWLGLGLFRFHLVLPLVLILLLNKKGKALFGFLVSAVSLGLISLAVVGWREALSYPGYVWKVENSTGSAASLLSAMPNLRGLTHTILPWTPRVAVAVSIVSAIVLLWAAFQWNDRRLELSFSLASVATILVSYHVLAHDLCLLLPPLALLADHFDQCGLTRTEKGLLLLGPMVVLLLSPVQMLLWFHYGQFGLLAPILLLWFYGISQKLSDRAAPRRLRTA